MSVERDFQVITVTAGDNSLEAYRYHVVTLAGDRAYTQANMAGILRDPVKAGENASVAVFGHTKFKAGGDIVAGAYLTLTASATFEQATSGDLTYGKCLSAVTSGNIGEGFVNFATPGHITSSL